MSKPWKNFKDCSTTPIARKSYMNIGCLSEICSTLSIIIGFIAVISSEKSDTPEKVRPHDHHSLFQGAIRRGGVSFHQWDTISISEKIIRKIMPQEHTLGTDEVNKMSL